MSKTYSEHPDAASQKASDEARAAQAQNLRDSIAGATSEQAAKADQLAKTTGNWADMPGDRSPR